MSLAESPVGLTHTYPGTGTDNIRMSFPLRFRSWYILWHHKIQVSTLPLDICSYWTAIFYFHNHHNHLQTTNFLDDSTLGEQFHEISAQQPFPPASSTASFRIWQNITREVILVSLKSIFYFQYMPESILSLAFFQDLSSIGFHLFLRLGSPDPSNQRVCPIFFCQLFNVLTTILQIFGNFHSLS